MQTEVCIPRALIQPSHDALALPRKKVFYLSLTFGQSNALKSEQF